MAEEHKICASADVAEGKGESFEIAGHRIAVFNVDGQFFAIADRCSHADAPMADGYVHRRELCVACPWHGAEFDLRTGKALTPPACEDIAVFPIRVEDGSVFVETP